MTTPDADLIRAKHQLASADTTGDKLAEDTLDRAARARRLVVERNGATPERVGEIDEALAELGYTDPLPTTAAQRTEQHGLVGRSAPGPDATAAKPSPVEAKSSTPAATSKPSSGKS
jgi:hypothetical protein